MESNKSPADHFEEYIDVLRESVQANISLVTEDPTEQEYFLNNLISMFQETSANHKVKHYDIKKTLTKMVTDHTKFINTVDFYYRVIGDTSDHFEFLNSLVSGAMIVSDICLTHKENSKLREFINSFNRAISTAENECYTLKNVLRTSIEDEYLPIANLKSDKLQKYYFAYVYDLKNNVKIFEPDLMIYGEINNIMRLYKRITDFFYDDLMFMYLSLYNLLKDI